MLRAPGWRCGCSVRRRAARPGARDPSPHALVTVVSCRGFDLFLSGDAESDALVPLALPDVEA